MRNGSAAVEIDRAQQRLAHAGGRHIGDLITWNCDRIDVTRLEAREVFATVGLGELLGEMEPATALSRATQEVRRSAGLFVRPFAKPKGDTAAAVGIYLQQPRDGEGGDGYVCGARCRVDRTTNLLVALAPEGEPALPGALAHAEAMAAHANHLITHAETRDISAALVGTAKALSGVPLRDRGGFYLLPTSTCGTFARLKSGLERLGVKPIRIEMHDAPDNVSVAKAAAQSALESDIAELMADLEKASSEGMRQHALVRRVEVCRELKAKAELYRGVLSGLTDKITAKVDALETQFQHHVAGTGGVSFSVPVITD